jgi:hypothetical protein
MLAPFPVTRAPKLPPTRGFPSQTPAGWDFGKTQTDFVTLLSPGVLNGLHRWLVRARLWRLILSQSTEGYWDASTTTAFALESRSAAETKKLPPALITRVVGWFRASAQLLMDMDEGEVDEGRHADGSSALDDLLDDGERVRVLRNSATGVEDNEWDADADAGAKTSRRSVRRSVSFARAVALDDCPITCCIAAIGTSVPKRLARLRITARHVNVTRVWTTMCCVTVLEVRVSVLCVVAAQLLSSCC